MGVIDLSCRQSFSFPPYGNLPLRDKRILSLGGGFQTFLFPEVPPVIGLHSLKQARLILYKIPAGGGKYLHECPCGLFYAFPLVDFFSVYGYVYAPPQIDMGLMATFQNDPDRCVTEIDITAIVSAWLAGTPENKGLLLTGNKDTCRIDYASDQYEAAGMRPMLRLTCMDVTICRSLSAYCCTVTINGDPCSVSR